MARADAAPSPTAPSVFWNGVVASCATTATVMLGELRNVAPEDRRLAADLLIVDALWEKSHHVDRTPTAKKEPQDAP